MCEIVVDFWAVRVNIFYKIAKMVKNRPILRRLYFNTIWQKSPYISQNLKSQFDIGQILKT